MKDIAVVALMTAVAVSTPAVDFCIMLNCKVLCVDGENMVNKGEMFSHIVLCILFVHIGRGQDDREIRRFHGSVPDGKGDETRVFSP